MIQIEFITSLLSQPNPSKAVEAGVSEEWFDVDNRRAFRFVVGFWRKYRKMPTLSSLKRELPSFESAGSLKEPLDYYIDELRKDYSLRVLRQTMSDVVIGESTEKPVSEVISNLTRDIIKIQRIGAHVSDHDMGSDAVRAAALDDYKRVQKAKGMRGLPTPWPELDDVMLGLQEEHFITVVARPGVGKTWLLCMLAHHATHVSGKTVLLLSKEMSESELQRRIAAIHLRLDARRLRRAQLDKKQEAAYLDYLKGRNQMKGRVIVTTDDAVGERTGTMLIRAKMETWKPDLVVVDGAYLLRNSIGSNKVENVYEVSQDLKRIAREFKTRVVASIQMGRPKNEQEARTGGGLNNVQWGDAWVQDSDESLELVQTPTMKVDRRLKLRLNKQREGELVELELHWDFTTMQFDVASSLKGDALTASDRERL